MLGEDREQDCSFPGNAQGTDTWENGLTFPKC